MHVFDDIINTDHKLISFALDLNIPKKPITKRFVYNYKEANWDGLNCALNNTPWDMAFVENSIDASLSNWCDLFLFAVSDHVPTRRSLFRNRTRSVASLMVGNIIDLVPRFLSSRLDEVLF